MSRVALTIIVVSVVLGTGVVHAKQTPEQKCQKGRYDAAAKYVQCQQKMVGKLHGGSIRDFMGVFEPAVSKCRVNYTDTWAKLQAKASGTGSTCDNPRYDTSVAGTVTDRLTGLQWEKKDDIGGIHDKDDLYSWGTSGDGDDTDEDGTAFTTFLAALNSGGCFAGQCGWRLPTIYELQTILLEPYPCTTSPCIDTSVFGPTAAYNYWSATTSAFFPGYAWYVNFAYGGVSANYKFFDIYVRAVRAGL